MVQCTFCLYFDGVACTEPSGALYGEEIDDPYMEVNCPAYLDKGVAGSLSPAFDDSFFDAF